MQPMMEGADLELFERSLRQATEVHTGTALDAALRDLGWHDAFDVDRRAAVSVLFELQGRNNVTSSALDDVVLGVLDAGGANAAALVLPALGRWAAPGSFDGDRVTVAGLGTVAVADRETALVVATDGSKDVGVLIPATDLTLRRVEGIDPSFGLVEVTAEAVATTTSPQPAPEWAAAVALGQLALGHELVGAARTMLDLAREHALGRIQFGVPIATFQAVRHRLADTLVAIETARAALDAAWLDRTPESAAMAKALAGRGARTAARHCQQVLAGIGFTTEHPLHLSIRRTLVLDQLLGSARALTKKLGEDLLRRGQLPAPLPL